MRTRKISIWIAGIVFLFSAGTYCAAQTSDDQNAGNPVEIEERVTNASTRRALRRQEREAKKQAKNAEKAASAASVKKSDKKKSDKEANENVALEKKINIVELVSGEGVFQARDVESRIGNIRLLLKGSVGSFQFYTVNKDSVSQPLLAGYDEFTSSFFSLRAGKKEYRLSDNIGIVIGTRQSESGAQMVYVVPKVARVLVRFDCLKSDENRNADILKVNVIVRNRSTHTEVFALKTVLDTFLGEQKGPHFSTAEERTVNSERQYRKFDSVKWISSANSKAAMQILLHGGDITTPEVVSLSNKDLLALPSWIPSIVSTRTFDSVLSYNNSAVCINWEEKQLAPQEEFSCTYYIATSSDGDVPAGAQFLAALENRLEQDGVSVGDNAEKTVDAFSAGEKTSASSAEFPVESQGDALNLQVPFTVDSIGADKLNYQYIQSLIDRINALEGSGENLDRNELLRLNAELDVILEKLRQS